MSELAITAAGPISAAAIAATGSDVLRHEHECGSVGDLDFDRVWCMGHICPSPCSHVHSAFAEIDIVVHKAVGTASSRHRWTTSQPAAARAS